MSKASIEALDESSPRTKADYLAISRRLGLPGRCPILSRCERHHFCVKMIDQQCGGHGYAPPLKRPIISIMEDASYTGGTNNFYLKNCCPEIGLFESDRMFCGLSGYPLTAAEYDKYHDPQYAILETSHFSECVEFVDYSHQQSEISKIDVYPTEKDIIEKLDHIACRFPAIVAHLANRRSNRPALLMNDEYDVQYLFQALLALEADDIRPEEWMPSVAGGSSRADCLLKSHKTIIEFKMTRPRYTSVQLRKELADDFVNYASHPDCLNLYVFVYDPLKIISNPIGCQTDLSAPRPPIARVRTFIQQA